MPDYCDPEHAKQQVPKDIVWGDTDDSFYYFCKGKVGQAGTTVEGSAAEEPRQPIGVLVTVDAEPMDAFDCRYIERQIVTTLATVSGVGVTYTNDRFAIWQAADANFNPERIGEVLIAAIRREWPKIEKVHVKIMFDRQKLPEGAAAIRRCKVRRQAMIDEIREEGMDRFYVCVGCSPFAPDHMCVITPQRPPQCNRPFEMIKTGALYGYDDMTNIHHSHMHRNVNSFNAVDPGECIDLVRGEWAGINAAAAEFTHGRTKRVQLHCIDEFPHTGCGCFRLIMFKTGWACYRDWHHGCRLRRHRPRRPTLAGPALCPCRQAGPRDGWRMSSLSTVAQIPAGA